MGDVRVNIERIRERIARAAERTGRRAEEITLVAVTKNVSVPLIREAIAAGITHIGENRVQEALKKYPEIQAAVKWHMIGHLQRNKVKYVLDIFDILHSLDRISLAEEIQRYAERARKVMPCLVQVNLSGETTKHGVSPEGVLDFVAQLTAFPGIAVEGVMTMAAYSEDPEDARPTFRRLRELAQLIAAQKLPRVSMKYLSMGMTGDFEVAIEEGSNMVRIGTGIFGARS